MIHEQRLPPPIRIIWIIDYEKSDSSCAQQVWVLRVCPNTTTVSYRLVSVANWQLTLDNSCVSSRISAGSKSQRIQWCPPNSSPYNASATIMVKFISCCKCSHKLYISHILVQALSAKIGELLSGKHSTYNTLRSCPCALIVIDCHCFYLAHCPALLGQ